MLAGAVANAVYNSDNVDLYDNLTCGNYYYYYVDVELCDDLERVYIGEGAAAVSSRNSCNMSGPAKINHVSTNYT